MDEARTLYAKTPVPGGETLEHHTIEVVRRLSQLRDRLPDLEDNLSVPGFWEVMFWAAWFHDFGKAASGFQDMLANRVRWGYRHEVLSLAFLDWVFAPESPELAMAAAAVASHHRDFSVIDNEYVSLYDPSDSLIDEKWSDEMDPWKIAYLADFTQTRSKEVALSLGFHLQAANAATIDVDSTVPGGPDRIRTALGSYKRYFERQAKPGRRERAMARVYKRQALFVRGLILQADRLASAEAPSLKKPYFDGFSRHIEGFGRGLFQHQKEAADVEGSALLAAPTGSGKTEAAISWARRQLRNGRTGPVLFLLPFQASINAMYGRFRERYGVEDEDVALMHSRSVQAIYRELTEGGQESVETATYQAKRKKSLAKLHQQPFCIATPYQLLRAAFRLPGYEGQWAMIYGSHLIVDEIHGYEPIRIGLLLAFFQALLRDWDAKIFCMTATMPSWLRNELLASIGVDSVIQADADVFQAFSRHRLHVREGKINEGNTIEEICRRVDGGESVLVVVNLVDTAQRLAHDLRQKLDPKIFEPHETLDKSRVQLLHSRFTGEDRLEKEKKLTKRVSNKDGGGFVAVATQVVEVSLDVDFDTLFSEPAPLEALVQRFGRVNRTKKNHERPVFVTDEPIDWVQPYRQEALLRRTVEFLRSIDRQMINEAQVSEWLDEVYRPDVDQLKDQIEKGRQAYEAICGPDRLLAFQSDRDSVKEFERLFDGMEVLPRPLHTIFVERVENGKLIEAYSLLVPISHGRFMALYSRGQIDYLADHRVLMAECNYNSSVGMEFWDDSKNNITARSI